MATIESAEQFVEMFKKNVKLSYNINDYGEIWFKIILPSGYTWFGVTLTIERTGYDDINHSVGYNYNLKPVQSVGTEFSFRDSFSGYFTATVSATAFYIDMNNNSHYYSATSNGISGSGTNSGGSGSEGTDDKYFSIAYGSVYDSFTNDCFRIEVEYDISDSSNTYKGIEIDYSFDGKTYIPAILMSDNNDGTSGTATAVGYKIPDDKDFSHVYVSGTLFGSKYNTTGSIMSIVGYVVYFSPPIITLSANPPILKYNDTSLILSINEASGIRTRITSGTIYCALSDTLSFNSYEYNICSFEYESSTNSYYCYDTDSHIDLTCIDISQFDIWSTLKLLNKKYIKFYIDLTISGSVTLEFETSEYSTHYYYNHKYYQITTMTDKDCPRVKDDNGIYQPYIPHIVKMDDPSNPVWSPCNYQTI